MSSKQEKSLEPPPETKEDDELSILTKIYNTCKNIDEIDISNYVSTEGKTYEDFENPLKQYMKTRFICTKYDDICAAAIYSAATYDLKAIIKLDQMVKFITETSMMIIFDYHIVKYYSSKQKLFEILCKKIYKQKFYRHMSRVNIDLLKKIVEKLSKIKF